MSAPAEPQEISAHQIVAAERGSVSGIVTIKGWLVFSGSGDSGWIATGPEAVDEPVVHFAEPGPVFERLGRSIGILGGGPYSFVNPVSVTGALGLIDEQYMLSDVEQLDVWESKRLRMKPLQQLQKRKD